MQAGSAEKKPRVKIKTLGIRMYKIKYFLCSDSFISYNISLCTMSICLALKSLEGTMILKLVCAKRPLQIRYGSVCRTV